MLFHVFVICRYSHWVDRMIDDKPQKYKNRGVKRRVQDIKRGFMLAIRDREDAAPAPALAPSNYGGSSGSRNGSNVAAAASTAVATTTVTVTVAPVTAPPLSLEERRAAAAAAAERRAAAAQGQPTTAAATEPGAAVPPEAAAPPEAAVHPEGHDPADDAPEDTSEGEPKRRRIMKKSPP